MRCGPTSSWRVARPDRCGATLADGYLQVNTSPRPAPGSSARRCSITDGGPIYRLRRNHGRDAVFERDAPGRRTRPSLCSAWSAAGHAAAFTYDLARSIVYTRQGNPAWAGQERDGQTPIRPTTCSSAAHARLRRPHEGRDPAGGRAAASAREPDRSRQHIASRCRGSGTSRAASKRSSS